MVCELPSADNVPFLSWLQAHASHPATALTCADSDPLTPNVPFDCVAYNMVYKPAAADLSVIEGDFTSFLTCCVS